MEKQQLLYEGKAKKVYSTEDSTLCIFEYKDDATAFNGQKKGSFEGKGAIDNRMANFIFRLLEKDGVKTHLVEEMNDRDTLVKKVDISLLRLLSEMLLQEAFPKSLE